MVEFLKKHETDANVAAVKADFDGLLAEFNKISEKDVTASNAKDGGKTAMLGGGKQLFITKEVYEAIVAKIKSIRNSYTLTK